MRRVVLCAAALALVVAGEAAAQDRRGIVTLAAGAANYDLSGTGWAPVIAARVGLAFGPWLILEPGITWMRYETQGDDPTTLLFPEAQLQLEILRGTVRPYIGAGAGFANAKHGDASDSDLTMSVSAGVRARLDRAIGFVAEGRLRSVDPFTGTTFDLTGGLSFVF